MVSDVEKHWRKKLVVNKLKEKKSATACKECCNGKISCKKKMKEKNDTAENTVKIISSAEIG